MNAIGYVYLAVTETIRLALPNDMFVEIQPAQIYPVLATFRNSHHDMLVIQVEHATMPVSVGAEHGFQYLDEFEMNLKSLQIGKIDWNHLNYVNGK